MSAIADTEEFHCRKCRMKFDSKMKLANHINKFCADSIYGEPDKLLKRLKMEQQESRNPSHLTFGEIKDFLQNNDGNKNIGNKLNKMSLNDLRKKFEIQGLDQDLEALKAEIIKRRENELIKQLKNLKYQQKQLIISRKQNESILSEKLEIFNKEKEDEMKTRLETERIKKILKNVDQKHLSIINQEKQKEIQQLKEIQITLKKQENKALNEINELTLKIQKEDEAFKHKKDELFKIKNKKGPKFEEIRMKIMENAQKHGLYSAKLQIEKNNLQNTKKLLLKQLENKNLNEKDKKIILNNIHYQFEQQINSINALKQQFENENIEIKKQMNIHDELFQKLTTYPDAVDLNDYFDTIPIQKKQQNEIIQAIPQKLENNKNTKHQEIEQEEEEEEEEKVEYETVTKQNNDSPLKPKRDTTPESNTQQYTKNDQQQQQPQQPPPWYPHQPPPPSLPQQHQNPMTSPYGAQYMQYPHSAPWYPQYPMMPPPPYQMMQQQWNPMNTMNPATNPVLNQLNQQFEITQKLLKQHELESELLQHEIKNMHNKQQGDKTKASQKEFQHTLHMLKSKLIHNDDIDHMDISPTNDTNISQKKVGILSEMNDFEKEERKLLTLISKFSEETELKQLYVEQLRSITSTKFELERLHQTKKLQKLKHEISSYGDKLTAESEHEIWMEEQKRLLERKKIEKELAAQGLLKRKTTTTISYIDKQKKLENKLVPLTNDGFIICFDFIIGFTSNLKYCRLATSIINGIEIQHNTLQTTQWESIYPSNNNDTFISMIQIPKFMNNLIHSTDLKLLIDVQCRDKENNENHYVWTMIMPLMINNDNNEWFISQGFWKLTLCNPPIMIQATSDNINEITKNQSILYFRIVTNSDQFLLETNDADIDMLNEYKKYDPLSLLLSDDHNGDDDETESKQVEECKDNERIPTATTTISIQKEIITTSQNNSISPRTAELYDEENGVGVLVKYLEHQSKYPFAKIKVSLYDKNKVAMDIFENLTIWETDFAQEGIHKLGIYEWEQRHIFENFPYLKECFVVFELFESKDPTNIEDNSRPLTSHSSHSNHTVKTMKSLNSMENSINNNHNDVFVPILWTLAMVFRMDETTNKPIIASNLHELNLYKYPIDFINPILCGQDSTLCVSIFDPENAPMLKNVILTNNEMGINELDTIQEISDRPWIRVENEKNTSRIFEDGDGIDLYVDGARFLPQNVTITKLYIQLMWKQDDEEDEEQKNENKGNLQKDGAPSFTYCDIAESAYNPIFNFRKEYRKDIFNKNCIFIFRIDTIEQYTKKCQIVGYSGINLFVENGHSNDNRLYLNEGAFQLSLYIEQPPFNSLSISNFVKKQRLPCSTLLVRIVRAPRSDDGTTVLGITNVDETEWNKYNIVIPSPNYGDGIYDTLLCEPSVQELRLYNSLMTTRNIDDKQISVILAEQFKNEIDLDLNDEIDEIEFEKWCNIKLKPPPKSEIEFIDLSHFAKYNQNMGIVVSIDGINNIEPQSKDSKDSLYIVIFMVIPPSTFYAKDFKITDNIQFTYNWNWSSLAKNPRFIFDKLQIFKDADFEQHENAILFTDIREIRFKSIDGINISDLNILKYGFSFFPLFTSSKSADNGQYVRNGTFQNIVFKHPENDDDILSLINKIIDIGSIEMMKTECALTSKQIKSKTQKILKPTDGNTSIFVRIYDNQRSTVNINKALDQGLSIKNINNNIIPIQKRNDYIYNPNEIRKKKSWFFGNKPIPLTQILANNKIIDQKSFIKKLSRAIAQKLDITHYNF